MTFGVRVEPSIYTGGQPSESEFKDLAAAGFRRVIDLRPSTEERGFDEASEAARQKLDYVRLPIAGEADLTLAHVKQLDSLLAEPGNRMTLVHCGSSNRVGALLALRAAWLKGATLENALTAGRCAGLTGLESAVRRAISNPEPPP
ncbi:MAG: sulfur transferase domain-containing protein [Steroidobacteraceae bacterium]